MSAPTASLLGSGQITKRIFDEASGAVRTIPAANTQFDIAISAADGDSVLSYGASLDTQKASITSASTGVIVPAVSVVGMKSFQLHTNTTSTIVGAQICTLEISPSDTDNVWFATSLTITPSTTASTVVSGTLLSTIARRARVKIAAAVTSGTFDIYLNAQAN